MSKNECEGGWNTDVGYHSLIPIHTNVRRPESGVGYDEVTLLLCEKCFRIIEVAEVSREHYAKKNKESKDVD